MNILPFETLHIRAARYFARSTSTSVYQLARALPFFHFIRAYEQKQGAITFQIWFFQKILGFNRAVYWGVHPSSKIVSHRNIEVGIDSNPGIEPGCYIQGIGRVFIGDHTHVAANVSIISANHDVHDLNKHVLGEVRIGRCCWIGAGAIILPDITLGDFTVVGAGSVVTRSFQDGYCVVAGNPARKVRDLDRTACKVPTTSDPYIGYRRKRDFDYYRAKGLLM